MELNPKLRLRRPIEVPFSNPNKTTVCPSIAFGSKKRKRCATWRVQNVTMRCQLVNVVAALITNTYGLPVSIELNTCNSAQFNAHSSSRIGWKPMICALMFIRYYPCLWAEELGSLPNGNPRVLMSALLQMTMATDDATERVRDPTTPSWKPAVILTSCWICCPCQLRTLTWTCIGDIHW